MFNGCVWDKDLQARLIVRTHRVTDVARADARQVLDTLLHLVLPLCPSSLLPPVLIGSPVSVTRAEASVHCPVCHCTLDVWPVLCYLHTFASTWHLVIIRRKEPHLEIVRREEPHLDIVICEELHLMIIRRKEPHLSKRKATLSDYQWCDEPYISK